MEGLTVQLEAKLSLNEQKKTLLMVRILEILSLTRYFFSRRRIAGRSLLLPARPTLQRHEADGRKIRRLPVGHFERRLPGLHLSLQQASHQN